MQEQAEQIRSEWLSGMTYTDIALKYGIDQRTAKRYVIYNLPLSQLGKRPFTSLLDPYDPLIRSMLADHPLSAKAVFDAIKEQGYPGGYTMVVRRVREVIAEYEASGRYPPDLPRARHISDAEKRILQQETLQYKIVKEKEYAAHRAFKRNK